MEYTETRPPLVDIPRALRQVPVGKTSLYKLFDEGELVAVKIGARTFVTQESIDAFVARLAAEPVRGPR